LNRIKFDLETIKFIPIFENATKSKVKDCIVSESGLLFIVDENEASKAIGKGGQNAKLLERMFKKKIKIVEFSPKLEQFIRNVIHPLRVGEITSDDKGIITLKGEDTQTKSMLIGRSATNLRTTENIVKRYFEIVEIKVI